MDKGDDEMKHYTAEEWADFARGVVSSAGRSDMQKHLDAGCRQCEKEAGFWKHVVEVAKRRVEPEPPQSTVRQAKAMLANMRLGTSEPAGPTVARLVFDSRSAPLAVGVRSEASTSRQLLFSTSEHRIDVRLEPQITSDRVSIIGQILDTRNPSNVNVNVPISLFSGRKLLAKTQTNDLGEFEFACDLERRLELRAVLPQGREISVALIEPPAWAIAAASHSIDSAGGSANTGSEKKGTRRKV